MKCCICGKYFNNSVYYVPYDDVCSSRCFSEKFWDQIELEYVLLNEPYIIIDGIIYKDGGYQKDNGKFLGYGGTEFTIQFDDGRKIFTNNLWCRGTIPDNRKNVLSNNARFV